METLWLNEKCTNVFIRGLLCLIFANLLPANELEEQSGNDRPTWTVRLNGVDQRMEEVTVKVGSNLTLSCVVDVLDLRYEVLRVSLLQGDVMLPLVENGLVHSPFSSIPRYSAELVDQPGNGVSVTVTLNEVQPEDTGTFICHKYLERENSAYLNVTISVPVTDVYITSLSPDGDEVQVEEDGEVVLYEHDFYGVGCVATMDGSLVPPNVRILIDEKDETESFHSSHQLDYSVLHSGLTHWNSHRRLMFLSSSPNPDFNEKQLRCVATRSGFPDVEATVLLFVQFAPLINCSQERIVARIGTSATFDCNIKANPGSRITWSSARGDLSNYPNVFFDETILSSDQTRLRLSIRDVKQINYQRYTLTAANIIDSSRVTFELLEDPTILSERHQEVENVHPEDETMLPESLDAVLSEDVQFPDDRLVAVPEITKPPVDVLVASTTIFAPAGEDTPEMPNVSPSSSSKKETTEKPKHEHNHRPKHRNGHFKTSEIQVNLEDDPPKVVAGSTSSSSEVGESSDEVDPPARPAEVHYSHSQASSSSKKDLFSSKKEKDSDKSKSTSDGSIALPSLILLLVVFVFNGRP